MNPSFASYKKVENSLLVHWLVSTRGLEVLEQPMVVTFSSNDKNFIIETLKKGIECNGSQYYYLGQSSSQLRHSTCYVMNASLTDLHGLLEKFENFNDIFPVAKRSQKIALPFSPFQRSLELKPGRHRWRNKHIGYICVHGWVWSYVVYTLSGCENPMQPSMCA